MSILTMHHGLMAGAGKKLGNLLLCRFRDVSDTAILSEIGPNFTLPDNFQVVSSGITFQPTSTGLVSYTTTIPIPPLKVVGFRSRFSVLQREGAPGWVAGSALGMSHFMNRYSGNARFKVPRATKTYNIHSPARLDVIDSTDMYVFFPGTYGSPIDFYTEIDYENGSIKCYSGESLLVEAYYSNLVRPDSSRYNIATFERTTSFTFSLAEIIAK